MAKHTTYRGVTIDMDSIRRENETVPAVGNMSVNAKGDQISRGVVTKTADQIARENHRTTSMVSRTSLKNALPTAPDLQNNRVQPTKKAKEVVLDNGDIIKG